MAILDVMIGHDFLDHDKKSSPTKEARAKAKLEVIALEGSQEMRMSEHGEFGQAIVARSQFRRPPGTSRGAPELLYVMYIRA